MNEYKLKRNDCMYQYNLEVIFFLIVCENYILRIKQKLVINWDDLI